MNSIHFSSLSNEWKTPKLLFKCLDSVFHFDLDPCTEENNLDCRYHYDQYINGLVQRWFGSVFVNPPYGREIKYWVKKSYDEVKNGNAKIVVMLIPARTDTKYFHDIIFKYAKDIIFLKGRIKFENGDCTNPAPFPSCLVIFS